MSVVPGTTRNAWSAGRRGPSEEEHQVERLHPSTLSKLPADVARPRYDRGALRAGIVHLGVGAFARAHFAVATEAALHSGAELRWGIVGVSLRQRTTRDALAPQDGLYSVALRGATSGPPEKLQVVGALTQVLAAPDDPCAVLARIAHPDTRIVSLTVTEKGYHRDPASGALQLDDPDIRHDLAHLQAPRTAIGFLVRGLHLRMQRERAPLTLLSLDNLPGNGHALRTLVLAFAEHVDAALHTWILSRCSFPNSVVDRIVPRTSDGDRDRIAQRLGLTDAWPVVAESYCDWVIEDRFAAGRPDWEAGGARFVQKAEPFERLKLRMVNGSHSALAYLGAMAGLKTVDRAVGVSALHRFLDTLMRDEIAPTLPTLPGIRLDSYRTHLLQRFANPTLQHRTCQIAMDGSQKLPQRLLDTLRDRLRANAPFERLALAVAAWTHYLRGIDETGQRYEIEDPLAGALAQQMARAREAAVGITDAASAERRRIEVFSAFTPVFGELGSEPRFVETLARHTLSLRLRGVLPTVAQAA